MLSVLHTVLSYMIYSTVQVGLGMELFNEITHTHTHLTALCPGLPG